MSSNSSSPPKGGGLSLYANLLDPPSSGSATISSAPVVYKQPGSASAEQQSADSGVKNKVNAALRFQPTRRPLPNAQKSKQKAAFAKIAGAGIGASQPTTEADKTTSLPTAPAPNGKSDGQRQQAPAFKSSINDWIGDEDDVNGFFAGEEKTQRGGRKKRKKNNKETALAAQDWDDIYDPARPNNYEEYLRSDEKLREIREWKDRLYAHRMRRRSSDASSDDGRATARPNARFAPPPNYSFAPPAALSEPATLPDDATGDDAYARRMRLTQAPPVPVPPQSTESIPTSPPPPQQEQQSSNTPATIVRAPVRYSFPAAPIDLPANDAELAQQLEKEDAEGDARADDGDELSHQAGIPAQDPDAPRSLRPGQKGFAARLMAKHGWTKGTGLGANSSGIINPLSVQVEKRKKKSDAEGGGFAGPKGGKGRIVGGKKAANSAVGGEGTTGGSKYGEMSEVVVLNGMTKGMDLAHEMQEGLLQEIGEECGDKYGTVERVYIQQDAMDQSDGAPVFVKFTSQLSALRAVNALEGRPFNGNIVTARFYDAELFEKGIYG